MKQLLSLFLIVCTPAISGQMFAVSGHHLYLDCQGKTSGLAVVLIAGGGGGTDVWDKVQTPISKFTRVCSYDRLGIGKSDALTNNPPQSVEEIVADLEGLLIAAQVHPPYILIGHSIGALYARAFDEQHDSQVTGMVLLDSSHEEQIWRFAEGMPEALSEYPRLRDQAFMSDQGFLPPRQHLTWHFSKPLIVIEHETPSEPVWHDMQKDLASRWPKSQFITAHSSRYIQKFQPDLVIEAVRSVVDHSRTEKTHRLQNSSR